MCLFSPEDEVIPFIPFADSWMKKLASKGFLKHLLENILIYLTLKEATYSINSSVYFLSVIQLG